MYSKQRRFAASTIWHHNMSQYKVCNSQVHQLFLLVTIFCKFMSVWVCYLSYRVYMCSDMTIMMLCRVNLYSDATTSMWIPWAFRALFYSATYITVAEYRRNTRRLRCISLTGIWDMRLVSHQYFLSILPWQQDDRNCIFSLTDNLDGEPKRPWENCLVINKQMWKDRAARGWISPLQEPRVTGNFWIISLKLAVFSPSGYSSCCIQSAYTLTEWRLGC